MERMTIGALAAATAIKVTTVRFYERAGLMPLPTRTRGRHRHYTNDHLQRLRFICRARELEFSIEDIRTLLILGETPGKSCREVQDLTAAHVIRLRSKIAALVKIEAMLADTVERCSGKLGAPCPVLELLNSVS
jgi:MerR family mercuric resistance operon transcriptional regulator